MINFLQKVTKRGLLKIEIPILDFIETNGFEVWGQRGKFLQLYLDRNIPTTIPVVVGEVHSTKTQNLVTLS